jgi:hypothetical protein
MGQDYASGPSFWMEELHAKANVEEWRSDVSGLHLFRSVNAA